MKRYWMDFYKIDRQLYYVGLVLIFMGLFIAITYLIIPPIYPELFYLEWFLCITNFIVGLGLYIYFKNMMKIHKDCETRPFSKLTHNNISDIERLLQKANINFEKKGEKRINYFVTFNEIMKIDDKIYLRLRTPYRNNQPIDRLHPITLIYLHVSIYTKIGYDEGLVKKLKSTIDQLDTISK